MIRKQLLEIGKLSAFVSCVLVAACSGGGSGSSPGQSATSTAVIPTPIGNNTLPDTATLGANPPVLATGNATLANMPLNTVLPLRQSIIDVAGFNISPLVAAEQAGATLTYKGTQTVNGVTGPVFELSVPTLFVTQILNPDGTGGPCCGFNDVNGKIADKLNYTLTGTWNAVADGTVCGICQSMFVTGFQTPSTSVPASGQASYVGNGANGSVMGTIYPAGGDPVGSISGSSSSFSVNFGTGQVSGTLSGLTATPLSTTGVAGTPQPWNQISVNGSLSGAVLTGSTSTPSQPGGSLGFGANSAGTIGGALFGPNAEELGAVWSLQDKASSKLAIGVVGATVAAP